MTSSTIYTRALKALFLMLFVISAHTVYAQQACDNITDGGSLSGNESGCNSPTFDPGPITSITPATGGSGELEYIWMKTTTDPNAPFNTWQIISGATGESLDPIPITQTTYYGRCARRAGCIEFPGEAKFITKSISCCNLDVTLTPQNTTACIGQSIDFSVTATGDGLTYLWEASAGSFDNATSATPSYTMMAAGTYTITVTVTKDGCEEMISTNVTIQNQLAVNITADHAYIQVSENLNLNGSPTGTGLSYNWTASAGAFNDNTLADPTYFSDTVGDFQIFLTVSDDSGCSGVDTFDIGVGACSIDITAVTQNAICAGVNTGSIDLTVVNSEGTLTYQWDNGIGNEEDPDSLIAGTYNVTVTDGEGCEATESISVGVENTLIANPSVKLPICSGESTGQILLDPSGGVPHYSYTWSNGASDTSFINNLEAGSYAFTITDRNGCTINDAIIIVNPTSLDLTTSTTEPECGASTGSATVTASGGTPNYTYLWNDDAAQTTATAVNLPAGIYEVTVTDANSCAVSVSVTINNTGASNIVLSTAVTPPSCGANNGAIDLTITGAGTNPTILWDNGIGNVEDPTDLAAGTYTVIVTDANSCSMTATATVTETGSPTVSIVPVHADCNNATGSATATTSGGTADFTYQWNDSANQTTATATNLAPGTYTVVVTDANGCTANESTTINGGSTLDFTITPSVISVCGGEPVQFTASISDTNYIYNWSATGGSFNDPTASNPIYTMMMPGTYTITASVDQGNNCIKTQTATVTILETVGLSSVATSTSCSGLGSGSIDLTITGGGATPTINWDNGIGNIEDPNSLNPGIYTVTVSNANGCIATLTDTITTDTGLVVTITPTGTVCSGENTGTVSVNVINGTAPYSYAWNNFLPNQSSFVGLAQGIYSVTVTDANGCQGLASAKVHSAEPIVVMPVVSEASCDENDGRARLDVSGGTPGYTYQWGAPLNQTTQVITGLAPGNYEYTVTDANACSVSDTITIVRTEPCTDTCQVVGGVITTTDTTTICAGDGNADIINVNITGNIGETTRWIVTDQAGAILEIAVSGTFDFDGAGFGTCLIWNLTYDGIITGLTVGQNINNLTGCRALSNSISVIRQDCTDPCMVNGGMISTVDTTSVCVGDGNPDIVNVSITGNTGETSSWIITDPTGTILELPTSSAFSFDDASFGTCLIWNLTYDGAITGLTVGQNINNLTGCRALSNSISVIRQNCTDPCMVNGGVISTVDTTSFCAGDGNPDIVNVSIAGNTGETSSWIITDPAGAILELPTSGMFSFDGAGFGTCLIWNLTYDGTITGLTVGQNINNLTGCRALSNSISVIRQNCTDPCMVNGGIISTTDTTNVCVGDGNPDIVNVSIAGNTGETSSWIITDPTGAILELPTSSAFSFDDASFGTCLIWNLTYDGAITGLTVGQNINNLTGCRALSNSISVIRQDCTDPCMVNGGMISTVDTTNVCVGDGNPDIVNVSITGNTGETSSWIITDPTGTILELPTSSAFSFDDASFGTCLIWNLTYDGAITGLTVGQNINNLTGCRALSNSISVIRQNCTPVCTVEGGMISTADTTSVCVGDGNADIINVILTGNTTSATSSWLVTDEALNILQLPNSGTFNFENETTGNCLIWSISYEDTIGGLTIGQNVANLTGCRDLSNSILVIKETCMPDTCIVDGGAITTTDSTSICVGDGIPDPINVTLTGTSSGTNRWIITNAVGSIIDLPTASPFDLENAGPGICLIWNVTYKDSIGGLALGESITALTGCQNLSNSISVIRNSIPEVTINTSTNGNAVCSGTSINLSTTPSNTVYSYAWTATGGSFDDANSATPVYTMMMPGSYQVSVTVSDGNCSTTSTTTVVISAGPELAIVPTDVRCAGDSTGAISLTITGGTAPYVYNWDKGIGNVEDPTGLPVGIYNVTVTDSLGCSISGAVTIGESSNLALTLAPSHPTCGNASDGNITATVTGGIDPIVYTWSNGAPNANTTTGLAAGTYSVTATDAFGCTATASTILTEPTGFDAQITSTPREICPGESVNFSATPNTTGLTYEWTATGGTFSDSSSASPIYTMMMPGTYEIIVTVSNGTCSDMDTTTVTVNSGITIAIVPSDVRCAGDSTGAINLTVSSDNEPISINWDNGLGNVEDPSNLAAGTYSVTVTDAARCTISTAVTIGETSNLTVNLTPTNSVCDGVNTGSITATSTGGIDSISYVWSTGATGTNTISDLAAGTYSVTATDAFGCSKVATTTLTTPTPLTVNITNSAEGTVICKGTNVNLSANPIDTNLTYSWTASGGSFDNSTSATPVYTMMMAGTHEIIVVVSNGNCTVSDTTTVTIGQGIDYTKTSTNIACGEDSTGTILLTIDSAALPIAYTWNNGIGNINNPTGLGAGTYTVILTDANGCTANDTVIITKAAEITTFIVATDIICAGTTDGSITANVSGGATPLSLVWSNGETNVTNIDSLIAGTYSLTVTDANGCTSTDSVTILENPSITLITGGINIGCTETGYAFVTPTGGTAPYTYAWNDATNQTTDTAYNLVAGIYTVVVTDANTCTATDTITISETGGISCNINVLEDIEVFNGVNGRLEVEVTGGSGNYTYRWNNGGMQSFINDLSTNTYIVTVTDDTNCECQDTLRLENPAKLGNLAFEDLDSNGIQGVDELGVPGVTIQVSGTSYYGSTIVKDTMTDENGMYTFSLPPGTYKITVVDALGYTLTNPDLGANDSLDSDINLTTFMSPFVTLEAGDYNNTLDVGLYIPAGCFNVLNGGSIKGNEDVCVPDGDPSLIMNVNFPSGGVGPLEYLWLTSTKATYYPGDPDWTEIPNSNAPDYDPGIISDTTYFIRCTRRKGCDNYPGESNIITKVPVLCVEDPSVENLRTAIIDGNIELVWDGKIPSENGNFIIERSKDGENFKVVTTMKSHLSEEMEEYHFMDDAPSFGENYYRVHTFQPNSTKRYSNVAMAMIKKEKYQKVMIYPNPVQTEATIHFLEDLGETANLQIVNGFGQIMQVIEIEMPTKRFKVDLSQLPSGMYYLKFDNIKLARFGQKIYKVEE